MSGLSQDEEFAGGSLPRARVDRLDEGAILVRGDALKVISDGLRKLEVGWIPLSQTAEEWRKQAAGDFVRLIRGDGPLGHADEAEPRLVQLARIIIQRRIQAGKVKGAVAAIAAEQETAAATGRAEVVVFRELLVVRQIMSRLHRKHVRAVW